MKKPLSFLLCILSTLPAFAAENITITRNLYLGIRSPQVALLQQKLQNLDYYPRSLQTTEYFGQTTKSAVRRFQKAHNIPATGYVGILTRRALAGSQSSHSDLSACLPIGTKLSDIFKAGITGYTNGKPTGYYTITIEQKLREIKALCNADDKLVDPTGKPVILYGLNDCWGNAPEDYQDVVQKQTDEINALREHSIVIEMTCNPSGIPLP